MEPENDTFDDCEVVIDFYPINEESGGLLTETFPDDEILESKAFSGDWIFTLILSAAVNTLGKALNFFIQHRASYKDAVVKIGKEEISLSGYSISEIENFFDNPRVHKALRELKKQ